MIALTFRKPRVISERFENFPRSNKIGYVADFTGVFNRSAFVVLRIELVPLTASLARIAVTMFYSAFKYFITALKARKYGDSVSNVEDGQNWVPVARDKIYGTDWIKRRRTSVHR